MAVVLRFAPAGMTSAKYDEIVRKLDQAGAGAPAGRLIMSVSVTQTIFA